MGDERDKVLKGKAEKKHEEPDVEAHKVNKANEEGRSEDEGPDVEAHKVLKKTEH